MERKPRVLLQFLVPGKEALETKVLGAVSKGKRRGTGREAQGTRQLATRSSSLHREHTTKPRNIHLSVLEPSPSEMEPLGDVLGGWSSVPGGWGAPSRNSEGAEQPATAASLASPHPHHAPGFRSLRERGRHPHPRGDAGPASTTAAPTSRTEGRKPGHRCQHSPGAETLFSQRPEAPHDSAARLRHCFTHPGPGRAGKRGDRLPVQSHHPNRPTGPARQAFS